MSHLQPTLDSWWDLTSKPTQSTLLNQDTDNNTKTSTEHAFFQRRIDRTSLDKTRKHWGHELIPKIEGLLRLGVRNVNSLPIRTNHYKNDAYMRDLIEGNFDVFCGTEINIAWHNISSLDKVYERF
jgi:hypothetical protein